MANSYTQIYIQVVFAVKGRKNLLKKEWRYDVFKYISGIIENKKHKSIIVNGYTNHVHCFIGLKPHMAISDLVRDIKNNSSNYINKHQWLDEKFEWQPGYGCFSYSPDAVKNVYQYILNQEEHHSKKDFLKEYTQLLDEYEIDWHPDYIFDRIE